MDFSTCSAALRSSGELLLGFLPMYSSTVATTSEGASSIETPQSANFETTAGSNTMRQLSTGASGMRALDLRGTL